MNKDIKIGDLNSTEKGTGARKSSGKLAFSLLPLHLLAGTARVLMYGCYKYKTFNWTKGMVWSECVNCIFRHLIRWWYFKEEYDQETGEHHLDHIMCNVLFLRHYVTSYKEGDDRPPEWTLFNDDEYDDFCQLFFPENCPVSPVRNENVS